MAAKNYSTEFKNDALNYLHSNGYSYYRTAKKFKVSINTIKSWDNYPNNLPDEIANRMELNRLKRSKSAVKDKRSLRQQSFHEELPDDVNKLIPIAIIKSLKRVIQVIENTSNPKDVSFLLKSIIELSKTPSDFRNYKTEKSALDIILEQYKNQDNTS
jgi:transposase-like protein